MLPIKPGRRFSLNNYGIELPLLTRTKLNTERLSCPQDWVAYSNTRSLLVYLDSRLVRIDSNDLCPQGQRVSQPILRSESSICALTTHKLVVSHPDKLVHGRTGHVLCNHDRTRYTKDLTEPALAVLISNLWQVPLRVW